jgi:hypothetical protein
MFAAEVLRAIERVPITKLDEALRNVWLAHGAGALTDDEAQKAAELAQARRGVTPPQPRSRGRLLDPARRRAAVIRRRHLAASGPMPPAVAANFTTAELSVMRIVLDEIKAKGRCDRSLGEIAARAGCCRTSAQNAIRAAVTLGLIRVTERRISGRRNLTNVIELVSPDVRAWLSKAQGSKNYAPRSEINSDRTQKKAWRDKKRLTSHLPYASGGT